jgi:hypothetical protein
MSRRLWPSPSWFSSQKALDYYPRTGFCTGTIPQSIILPPQSRTSNGDEGAWPCKFFLRRGPSRFFFHQRVKSELAGILLSRDSFKTICDVVIQTIAKDKFVDVFQQWMDCCGKCG